MIKGKNIRLISDEQAFNQQAADYVISVLGEAIETRGNAYLALSGGLTPIPVFEVIARNQVNALNWSKLNVFWVDERCVPLQSHESNFGNAYRSLFKHLEGVNLYRIKTELEPELASTDYEEILKKRLTVKDGFPVFDLIWLGMGKDGHTASLFPGTNLLLEKKKWIGAEWIESLKSHRVSMTFPVLNNARKRMVTIKGSEKYSLFKRIQKLQHQKYPIQKILNMNVEDRWFVNVSMIS